MEAQTQMYESLNSDHGLSQGMIYDILQTNDGFLWFATKNGLNKFDGYKFDIYQHDPEDTTTISGSVVTSLLEDIHGNIWVGTQNSGLNIFDKSTKKFFNVEFPTLLKESSIWQLSQSPDGSIWVGSFPNTITKLTGTQSFSFSDGKLLGLENVETRHIIFNDNETFNNIVFHDLKMTISSKSSILIACSKGLYEIDQNTMAIKQIDLPLEVANVPLTAVFEDGDDLYIGGQGVFLIKHRDHPWHIKKIKNKAKVRLITKINNKIFFNHYKQSYYYTPKGNFETADEFGQLIFLSSHRDKSGNYWLGTNGLGLVKFNFNRFSFDNHLIDKSIAGISCDTRGNKWIKSSEGFRTYDFENRMLTTFPAVEGTGKHIPTTLVQDSNKVNWQLHESKNQPTYLISSPLMSEDYDIRSLQVRTDRKSSFVLDDHTFWINGIRGTISKYNLHTGTEEVFNYSNLFGQNAQTVSPKCLIKSKMKGTYWIGTNAGLLKMELKGIKPKFTKINDLYIHHIYELPNKRGGIDQWVSTKTEGLLRIRNGLKSDLKIDERNGLPDQEVYASSIGGDYLWCSTNRGIARCGLENQVCHTYSNSDGLKGLEFNSGAVFKDSIGLIYFGGTKGLVRFDPSKVNSSSFDPPIAIVELTINGENMQNRLFEKKTTLSHDENLMVFKFASLDYTSSKSNRYKYRLKGGSEDWISIGTQRTITLGPIQPGSYVFEVLGTNADGGWSTRPARFAFKILPPWWRSSLAYISYFMLVIGLLGYFYNRQLKEFKLKKEIEFQQNEVSRQKVLEQAKSRFFSNITHELRTPLTLIQDPARRLRDNESDPKKLKLIELISSHSDRLLSLVNTLLSQSKLVSGTINVEAIQGDLSFFIQKIIERFEPMANAKNLDFSYINKLTVKYVTLDFDKIDSIISNLLSNAIKYTDSGNVTIEAQTNIRDQKIILSIDVADSGPGIPKELEPKIFDRFERGNFTTSSIAGNGIGLDLSKELVHLLGGSLLLLKSDSKGSIFRVELPLNEIVLHQNPKNDGISSNIPTKTRDEVALNKPNETLILIVEDNDELRQYIASCLDSQYQIIQARDGKEGLDLAIQEIPDIIIADYIMPQMSGMELVEKLKESSLISHIPVIMLTAKSSVQNRIEGVVKGAEVYLTKPFNYRELEAYIHTLLRQRNILLSKYSEEQTKPRKDRNKLLKPKDQLFIESLSQIVQDNIENDDLDVDFICGKLFISRSQLHRKIKQIAGCNTSQFVNNLKLDTAYDLLQVSSHSVKEISYSVGFSSPKYFSTLFKEKFGKSPIEVRPSSNS